MFCSVYRISGSIGWVAAARSAWLVTPDLFDPDNTRRLMLCVKLNIAEKPEGFVYQIASIEVESDTFVTTAVPFSDASPAVLTAEEACHYLRLDEGRANRARGPGVGVGRRPGTRGASGGHDRRCVEGTAR